MGALEGFRLEAAVAEALAAVAADATVAPREALVYRLSKTCEDS